MTNKTSLAVVGTYTNEGGDGLVSVAADHDGFRRLDMVDEDNPSFLAPHPSESFVVAVNELEEGSAVTYYVDPETGRFTRLDRVKTDGTEPCHIAIDPRGEYAVISHYASGSVALLPIRDDGDLSGPVDLQTHNGSGPDPDRQMGPHPHSAWFVTESIIYVPDLGTDQLFVYELDRNAERLDPIEAAHADVQAGAGPRHFTLHPSEPVGYLLNELDVTLTVVNISNPRNPKVGKTVSILPDSVNPTETIAADVRVHPSGEYVIASSRGHDSLTTFDIRSDPSNPVQLGVTVTGGNWPRNFEISPIGDFVYVCHQHSDDIVPFGFDSNTGELLQDRSPHSIKTPACMKFL